MKRKNAFTLVELLITIGIIVIIAGVAIPQVAGYINRSKNARAKMDMSTLSTAMKCFYTDWGKYPNTLSDLKGEDETGLNVSTSYTISGLPGGIDYLGVEIPVDIFNTAASDNEYNYSVHTDGQKYVMWSIGADGTAQIVSDGIVYGDDGITITAASESDDVYDSNCVVTVEVAEG